MPEDNKPYLQKVYNFLNTAYGSNGSLSKDVFTLSYADFEKKISSNPKYVDNIYTALDAAYGPNGKLKAGALSSSADAFKIKVSTPKQQAAQNAPEQVSPSGSVPTQQQELSGPAATLLAGSKDLQLPDQQQSGVMADQSAIEPLIAKQQEKNDRDLERGKQLLLQPKSELAVDMSGNQAPPTNQEISIQDRLHQMDEQDKNLHAAQGEADEFAKTNAGKLYYNFVRPVYQSLQGTGANLLSGGTRILGDAADQLGIDGAKKFLDKTADTLTDFFDFNRLAREGNTSSYLNMTPTSQQGRLGSANILPKGMEAITSMATLIGGGEVLGGGAMGLFTSNYLATYEDFRKQAKQAGLNDGEADQFAITSAGVNSAILMISPETFMGKAKGLPLADKGVFNAIKSGVSVKEAVKMGVKNGLKTLGEANAIVLSTDVANRVLRTGADLVTGERHFNESSLAPSMNEALESTILTSIAMGALNGRRFGSENKPSSLERSAWAQAAERPELIENGITKATEAGTLPPEQAQQIRADVAEYREIYKSLQETVLPKNPNADIPRMALDALKSKKQSEQSKPLSGIPALNVVTEQTDIDQAQTESDIRDGMAGIPEVGEQVSPNELKERMMESGGGMKTHLISKNDYKTDMISLDDLYRNNEKFKQYVDESKLRPSDNKEGLRMPVVMNADGTIVDGMNRLAQQYVDGNHTARAFVETKQSEYSSERAAELNKLQYTPLEVREQSFKGMRDDIIGNGSLTAAERKRAQKLLKKYFEETELSPKEIKERIKKEIGITVESEGKWTLLQNKIDIINDKYDSAPKSEQEPVQAESISELPVRVLETSVAEKMQESVSTTTPIEGHEQPRTEPKLKLIKRKNPIQDIFNEDHSSEKILTDLIKVTDDPFLREHGSKLLPYLEKNPGIKFKKMFSRDNGLSLPTGEWTAKLSSIHDDRTLAYVVVHELYHSISVNAIDNNKVFRSEVSDLLKKVRDKLGISEEYFNVDVSEFRPHTGTRDIENYGLLNEKEFIAEIFSNKKFADKIDGIKLEKKGSALSKFVDIIKKLTGLKGTKSTSEEIREAILKKLPLNVELSNDKSVAALSKNFIEGARAEDYVYNPILEIENVTELPEQKQISTATHDGPTEGVLAENMAEPATEFIPPKSGDVSDTNVGDAKQSTGDKVTFKTERGSVYEVNGNSTTRNKKARPEHPGENERGLQPPTEKTFYLTKDQLNKLDLIQTQGWKEGVHPVIAVLPDGKIAVGITGGADHGKFVGRTLVEPSLRPEKGLYPLEIWDNGVKHHFGNKIIEVSDINVADLPQPIEPKTVKPKSTDEAKSRRDVAAQKLKDAYNNLGNVGIVSDPNRTVKQQVEFNKALVNYAKEEILYRANQVKNFGRLKKAQIKSAIRRAMNAEGVKIGISDFTDIFNDAYKQIKSIPGVLGENVDRITMRDYIKSKIQAREQGKVIGANEAKMQLQLVRTVVKETLAKFDVKLTDAQQERITSLLEKATTSRDIYKSMQDAIDITTKMAAENKTKQGDKGFSTVSFQEYIKGKMQAREKGKQEGFKIGKDWGAAETKHKITEQFKAVKGAINETLKDSGVNLTMLQKRRIISMLQQSLTAKDINKSINRAIDATTQMVWEAQHKIQIADTKKLIKSVNALKKSKSMVLQDIEWIKQLQLPNPARVDDLGTYQEMLQDYVSSRRGKSADPKYTKEEISEFVQDENIRIYKEKMDGMQSDLDALKEIGAIQDDVNLDSYIALLDYQASPRLELEVSIQHEILKNETKKRLGYLKDRLQEFDGEERSVISKLTNVDLSEMEGLEVVRLNNVLNNIAEYGTPDAAGDIITSHEARVMNRELAKSGDKLRALPADKILSKKNLSNYISALFYNDGAISRFRAKVLGGIENKTSHVKERAQKVVKEFVTLNKRHKINGLSNAKLHAYSYLNQYRGIEKGEIADNLSQRLDELIDDATYLYDKGIRYSKKAEHDPLIKDATNRLEALKQFGLLDYSINDGKIKIDIKDAFDSEKAIDAPDILHSMLTDGEQAVYKFVRDHYDELTDKLSFVTRTYAGKEFQNERNYVSLVSRPKREVEDRTSDLSGNTDITGHLQSINARPANTTISRSNKKSSKIYYDGDFFSNFVNRYYTSLYTAEVLPDLQRTAKLVNSPEFKKFMTGQFDVGGNRNVDHNYVKFKEKLSESINEEKYSPFFKKGKEPILDKVMSKSVRMILGNIFQGPAQYAPAFMHNLTINKLDAVVYAAFTSRGKSIANREYGEARQKFLNNFTGVQRSALGSEAYDHYVKTVTDNAGWWTKPQTFLDKTAKLSSYVLEKADHMAQNDAYIASYISSLLKQGKISSVKEFDIAKEAETPNKEALSMAEQFASNINNESAKAYRAGVLKDANNAKWLWMLQGFSLNAYQNAMNKLKIVSDNRATGQEKKEAYGHFLGYVAEVGSYQLLKHYARGIQMAAATALLSAVWGFEHKESEEEKKERETKEGIKTGANIAADFALSGLPAPAQGVIKITANVLYKTYTKTQAKAKKQDAKQKGGKFDPRGTYLSPYFAPYYGVDGPGGAADIYLSILKKGTDKIEEGANMFDSKDTVEDSDAKKLGKQLNAYLGIPATILGSGDLMLLNTRMQTILKEASKKEKKPAAGGGSARGGSRTRSTRSGTSR